MHVFIFVSLRAEFDLELKSTLDWMDRTESTLALLVSDTPEETFTVDEQRVLIQVWLSVCLSTCLSIYISLCLSVCLSFSLSLSLSLSLSISLVLPLTFYVICRGRAVGADSSHCLPLILLLCLSVCLSFSFRFVTQSFFWSYLLLKEKVYDNHD